MTVERDLQTTLDNIKTGLAQVAARLQAQADQIATLTAQLAAGTPVTQEQLDALNAEAAEIASAVTAMGTPAST